MRHLAIIVFVGACATAPLPSGPRTSVAECVTGAIANLGVDEQEMPVLRLATGHPLPLTGLASGTVLGLTGATVTVCGPIVSGVLQVASYEIRFVDGMQAYLGSARETRGTWYLDVGASRPLVPLSGVPEAIQRSSGQLFWVAGTWVDHSFAVRSFGAIRP